MLQQWPLVLKLWLRDRYSHDTLLGLAEVRLAKVFNAPMQYRGLNTKMFSTYTAWQRHAEGSPVTD
jgi:hypothetical protein